MTIVHRCPLCSRQDFETDAAVVLHILFKRREEGITTLELEKLAVSANPSQRRAEIVDGGFPMCKRNEVSVTGRRMTRYWLAAYAPDDATACNGTKGVEPAVYPPADLVAATPSASAIEELRASEEPNPWVREKEDDYDYGIPEPVPVEVESVEDQPTLFGADTRSPYRDAA